MNLRQRKQENAKNHRSENAALRMSGNGLFLYKNKTNAELILPKPAKDGKSRIPPGGLFIGDDYFKYLFFPHTVSIVQEIIEQKEVQVKEEILLTEQPPVYTEAGQVEYAQIRETIEDKPNKKKKLLTEPTGDKDTFAIIK